MAAYVGGNNDAHNHTARTHSGSAIRDPQTDTSRDAGMSQAVSTAIVVIVVGQQHTHTNGGWLAATTRGENTLLSHWLDAAT